MGSEEDWRGAVRDSYQQWKYNTVHKDIKTYFSVIQSENFGQPFKKDSRPLIANMAKLKEDIEEAKLIDKVIKKRDGSTIEFMGKSIDVGDADDDEVDAFCKLTVFSGFWKTITKLCNSIYLALKSVGDVMKKLLKKLVDFFEAGMMKSVTVLGSVVAEIVAWSFPLPDYEEHEDTGVLCVPDLEFNNYGETVQNTPRLTFFPKTVEEIQTLVR